MSTPRACALALLLTLISGPLAAQESVRWEYATLVLVGAGRVVPVWSAGDSTAVLEWPVERDVVGRDTKPRTIREASSYVRVLNALGEQGWELVVREADRVSETYVFKRRKP